MEEEVQPVEQCSSQDVLRGREPEAGEPHNPGPDGIGQRNIEMFIGGTPKVVHMCPGHGLEARIGIDVQVVIPANKVVGQYRAKDEHCAQAEQESNEQKRSLHRLHFVCVSRTACFSPSASTRLKI